MFIFKLNSFNGHREISKTARSLYSLEIVAMSHLFRSISNEGLNARYERLSDVFLTIESFQGGIVVHRRPSYQAIVIAYIL